jgi:hypothetical protein
MGGRAGDRVRGWGLVLAVLLPAAPALALELTGAAGRWTVGGYTEGYAVFRVDQESPRQRPAGLTDLTLTGDVHPRARVFLDTRATFGGTPEHGDGVGIVNLSDTFQNPSPFLEIEEGYVDLFLPHLDVRVGKQKFAWGKLDTFQPTDVLNPKKFTDPFVTEEQDAKVGIPAVRAAYYLPALGPRLPTDASLTLIWVPVPIPTRFPLQDERWFPPAVSLMPERFVPGKALGKDIPNLLVHNTLATVNARPPQQLDEGAVGLRLAGLWGRTDWALYFYDGSETAPAFALDTSIFARNPTRFRECLLGQRPRPCPLEADATLRPIFGRIRLFGGDAAVELGGFTARVEGAYGSNRLLPRSVDELVDSTNLAETIGPHKGKIIGGVVAGQHVPINLGDLFVARDTVQWGAGLDYRVAGWMPVLQVNQTVVLDNRTTLLVNDVDTRLFFVVRKGFLAERLQTEVGVLQEIERGYTTGITRVTYGVTDHLRLRVGYLLLAGTRQSVVGQFHRNDEGFVQLRYSY